MSNEADRPLEARTGPTVYVGQLNTGAVANFISKQQRVAERAGQEDVAYSLGVVEEALVAALRMDQQVVKAEQTSDYGGLFRVSEEDAAKDYVYNPDILA